MPIQPWLPPLKPGEISEARLIRAILDGTFPIHSDLPGERELAALLGVTRPTLREAMQRLERDGWIDIRHGKPTRVRDFWKEGNLGVSLSLAKYQDPLPEDFVPNLLQVRTLLAPAYTKSAVASHPQEVSGFLEGASALGEDAGAYADFDWRLHWTLTIHSGNPFFTQFANSVRRLYLEAGERYFNHAEARAHSQAFYKSLQDAARRADGHAAGRLAAQVMQESLALWLRQEAGQGTPDGAGLAGH